MLVSKRLNHLNNLSFQSNLHKDIADIEHEGETIREVFPEFSKNLRKPTTFPPSSSHHPHQHLPHYSPHYLPYCWHHHLPHLSPHHWLPWRYQHHHLNHNLYHPSRTHHLPQTTTPEKDKSSHITSTASPTTTSTTTSITTSAPTIFPKRSRPKMNPH